MMNSVGGKAGNFAGESAADGKDVQRLWLRKRRETT
jgi:hypothetical protein